MDLLRRIETYLRRTNMPPARFGRDAGGDPSFVFDLRNGREPRQTTIARVQGWLDRLEGGPEL